MKKTIYTRPLAEVIELEVQDIITASFSNQVKGFEGEEYKYHDLGNQSATVSVDDAKIILK